MSNPSTEHSPRWRPLLDETALSEGSMVSVQSGRHDVLLLRTGGEVHAFGNLCPHKMCPLADGKLENGAITCGGHRWSFDAVTGRGINPRGATLRVYALRVVDGRIEGDLS